MWILEKKWKHSKITYCKFNNLSEILIKFLILRRRSKNKFLNATWTLFSKLLIFQKKIGWVKIKIICLEINSSRSNTRILITCYMFFKPKSNVILEIFHSLSYHKIFKLKNYILYEIISTKTKVIEIKVNTKLYWIISRMF